MYDPVLANKLNFEENVHTLEQTLHSWKRRKLTLIGEINIVKSLARSSQTCIQHLACNNLEAACRQYQQNYYLFLFGKTKPPKLRQKNITSEKKRRGQKMIDIEIMKHALKIAWIKCNIEGGDAS